MPGSAISGKDGPLAFPSSSASAITADNQLCSQRGTERGTFVTLSNQAAVPFRIRSIAVTLQFNREPACAKTKLARNKMGTKALEKRTVKRTKMVVGLRFPKPQPHAPDLLVHTLDISSVGRRSAPCGSGSSPAACFLSNAVTPVLDAGSRGPVESDRKKSKLALSSWAGTLVSGVWIWTITAPDSGYRSPSDDSRHPPRRVITFHRLRFPERQAAPRRLGHSPSVALLKVWRGRPRPRVLKMA